ncbi:Trifunctional nucleotide phosphoesterase protein YfkN [Grifola frondosa]|uniref:Trifunctional nucleotide phosphoesterase protein YfkN n=1 Tax=Grifola frondosa TaxID=5627 RepID=A0A1C7MFD4_GRIFR|nr:Trifunctional nucleotide phosphoesterase protein YfkN [Grifola frondosa]
MVPVMNAIAPDISLTGNHDFDFGYPHLQKLMEDTKFPWILSNIIDTETNRIPEALHETYVLERSGIRIGFIGLVEKEWISTVPTWPSHFKYRDMAESTNVDIVIALTHSRVPNDIKLAKALHALSPAAQAKQSIADMHGVDIIFGGHDHLYYVSRGVTSWEDYDTTQPVLGAEADEGDVLIVKSGTDFRDLSECTLELEDTPRGSVRKKVIRTISGKHHETRPGSKRSERIAKLLESLLSSVSASLKAPICKTAVELDLRSSLIRVQETAAANWFADVLRHAYDDAPCLRDHGGSDGVFVCAGTLRGDSIYGPGNVSLGDILEILPFEDPIIVLELDGETIWAALEASLETWPAQEGRFPVISGFRVSWDSRRPPGKRVLGIWLLQEPGSSTNPSPSPTPTPSGAASPASMSASSSMTSLLQPAPVLIDGDPILRVRGGRKYRIVSREYMASGHDGFEMLKGQKYLVDDESGQMMSIIVRKYVLGCRFVNRLSRMINVKQVQLLHADTAGVVSRERARKEYYARRSRSKSKERRPRDNSGVGALWKRVAGMALRWSRGHYRDNLAVVGKEHMSEVDCFDGSTMRKGLGEEQEIKEKDEDTEGMIADDEDLVTINPVADGRLKDEGRSEQATPCCSRSNPCVR